MGACYFWVYTATIHAYLDTDPGWAVSANKGIKDLVRDAHGSSVLCNRRAGDALIRQVLKESVDCLHNLFFIGLHCHAALLSTPAAAVCTSFWSLQQNVRHDTLAAHCQIKGTVAHAQTQVPLCQPRAERRGTHAESSEGSRLC